MAELHAHRQVRIGGEQRVEHARAGRPRPCRARPTRPGQAVVRPHHVILQMHDAHAPRQPPRRVHRVVADPHPVRRVEADAEVRRVERRRAPPPSRPASRSAWFSSASARPRSAASAHRRRSASSTVRATTSLARLVEARPRAADDHAHQRQAGAAIERAIHASQVGCLLARRAPNSQALRMPVREAPAAMPAPASARSSSRSSSAGRRQHVGLQRQDVERRARVRLADDVEVAARERRRAAAAPRPAVPRPAGGGRRTSRRRCARPPAATTRVSSCPLRALRYSRSSTSTVRAPSSPGDQLRSSRPRPASTSASIGPMQL